MKTKDLTATQARALRLIEAGGKFPPGRPFGAGTGIRKATAKALADLGLVVLGTQTQASASCSRTDPWAIPASRVANPPTGFRATSSCAAATSRGRPPRAGAPATVKIEFRVTSEERAAIASTLEASSASSLSELLRALLAAEAARLVVLS